MVKIAHNKFTQFCVFFLICFCFQVFAQEAQLCSGGAEEHKGEKPRFCFFSFNGKDESEGLCRKLWELEIEEDVSTKNCQSLPVQYRGKIEIKEYYADTLNSNHIIGKRCSICRRQI